jgi:RimJ/RimL family protein N-acetyltransferase
VAFPDHFTTARLRAERLRPDHLADLEVMDSDPQFMALLGGVRSHDQTAAYLERNLAHWTTYGFGLWMLWDTDGNQLAGRAVLRHLQLDDQDEVEVGYGFHPAFWGRGLATEIASACVAYAWSPLGLRSVVALTMPVNARSRHVLSKVGLAYERHVEHEGVRHVLYRLHRPQPDPDHA